ncbi:hypothetical protein M5K25_024063 [Dendrobium thyrsiflorum]|uniref:Uncharacterized protein n=1 Tax=Dendrobium thyrsiflorum TaxID=117978 RepID=A0ABD0U1C8_DENTH
MLPTAGVVVSAAVKKGGRHWKRRLWRCAQTQPNLIAMHTSMAHALLDLSQLACQISLSSSSMSTSMSPTGTKIMLGGRTAVENPRIERPTSLVLLLFIVHINLQEDWQGEVGNEAIGPEAYIC